MLHTDKRVIVLSYQGLCQVCVKSHYKLSARYESTEMSATLDTSTTYLYYPGGSTLHTYTIQGLHVVCGAAGRMQASSFKSKLTRGGIYFTLRIQSFTFNVLYVVMLHYNTERERAPAHYYLVSGRKTYRSFSLSLV